MAEQSRTLVRLVSGESITVDGDVEQVLLRLTAGSGDLQAADERGSEVYINANHVTHLDEFRELSSEDLVG